MTRRGGDEFLEELIAAGATQQRPSPSPSPAFQVTQAWAKLRTRQQPHHLQEALAVLRNSRHSLYIGEPQVRLLLSLVSSSRQINEEKRTNHENDSTGSSSADVEAIGSMRASVALIISIWVRRFFLNDGTNKLNKSSKSATTLQAVADAYCDLLQVPVVSDFYICESILLLGAVCATQECYANTRELCQTALVEELTIRRNIIVKSSALPEALAGVGYTMSASRDSMLTSITGALLLLWTPTSGDYEVNLMKHNSCKPPLDAAVMVLRLFEFLGRWLMSSNGSHEGANAIYKELLRGTNVGAPPEVKNVTVMAAAGVLRGTFQGRKMDLFYFKWLQGLESLVTEAAAQLSQGICNSPAGAEEEECVILSQYITGNASQPVSDGTLHQLRCVSLAVASCRDFPAHPSVLFCLVFALLGDVLNLAPIYSAQVSIVLKALKISESRQASIELRQELHRALEQLKMRVEGVIFREVGAIARAMCEQYRRVAVAHQQQIEMIFWKYSLELYQKHRIFAALCSEEFLKEGGVQFLGELQNEDLNKVLEAVFLSTVLLFSSSVGGKMSENDSATGELHLRKHELAPFVLDSLSCVEYFRHLQVPEYSETVRQCAALVSESRTASVKLANLLPSYQDVISWPGESTLYAKYSWCLDEVQSSRVHFYLRVLPLCLAQLDDVLFANHIAPIAFLYMCHPAKQLVEASHAVFVSFISRTRDSEELNLQEVTSLVEQLAVYYVIRALEGYPDLTPFEGLVSGVTAIVRELPAGSAAIVHCIDCLVDKAVALFSATSQDTKQEDSSGAVSDDDEAAHKIQTLLAHLILLVDIQVLPHLLKQLAKLILSLPSAAQERALKEALAIIAGSDDYVRKPIVVPWLQSLAFLSSTGTKIKEREHYYTGFFGRNSRL